MENPLVYDQEHDVKVPVFFLQDGRPAPYYILTDPISKQAAGFWSCINDLDECAQYITLLKDMILKKDVPEMAKKSLYISAVVTYIRCYNDGDGRPVQLDYKEVYRGKDPSYLIKHEEIKDVRNKNFGHASSGKLDSNFSLVLFNPEKVDFENIETKIHVNKLAYAHDLDKFFWLIDHSKEYVQKQLDKILSKFRSNILSMDINDIFSKSKTPDPKDYIKDLLSDNGA
jgi:hypothetical protein